MSESMSTPLAQEAGLHAELEGLRQGLLPLLVPAMMALTWLWCISVGLRQGISVPLVLFVFLPAVAGRAALAIRAKHFLLAAGLLALPMVAANGLAGAWQASLLAAALGIATIIVAHTLLGTWLALLAATLLVAAQVAGQRLAAGGAGPGWSTLEIALFYYLAWGAAWLAWRPWRHSADRALTGWAEAHAALAKAREREDELRGTVRLLEQATERITRVNVELLAARREAEEARAQKARFAAAVSHELRGPLNLILGFSRLMVLSPEQYGARLPRTYRADIDAIYRSSQHLVDLVDDVLDLSQIEAQHMPLLKAPIDLERDVVQPAIDIVEPVAQRKRLRLRLELAGDLPPILADSVRLTQVLLNLLFNAVRVTADGGITVRTARAGDALLVSVRDGGPGISEGEMPKLFQEFHRAQQAETREAAGSGLGLSIAMHLAELHGGTIEVASALGAGSIFTIRLPLRPAGEASPPAPEQPAAPQPQAVRTCLIVHDDADLLRLLARHLEGYHVVGVANERDVATLVEALRPQGIIAAVEASARIVEALRGTPYDVPVIACTLPQLAGPNHAQGITGYLIKPVMPQAVAAALGQVERHGEMTILVVGDDPDAVHLLEGMLTSAARRCRVVGAYGGAQALEIMRTMVPDAVFLDLATNELEGQVVARMRVEARLAEVPVIIVTAQDRIDETATVAAPIVVHYGRPASVVRAAHDLAGLLDSLSPSCVREPAASPTQPAALPQ